MLDAEAKEKEKRREKLPKERICVERGGK